MFIIKNKRIFYWLLLIITISGCAKKYNSLYNIVNSGFNFPDSPPLILSFYESTNYNDTITCCISSYGLYKKWNLITMDDTEFTQMLYNKIISSTPLKVDKELFGYLKEFCEVKPTSEIKTLYEKKGIKGVLGKYLDEHNTLIYLSNYKENNYDYIIYLCFINNLYFSWDDETGNLYLFNPPN